MKEIYTRYQERLIEINGNNNNLFVKTTGSNAIYDLGAALAQEKFDELWQKIISDNHFCLYGQEKEFSILKKIQRNSDDELRETGKRNLFIGLPFVIGSTDDGTQIKAPLFLFPSQISIHDAESVAIDVYIKQMLVNRSLIKALRKNPEIPSEDITNLCFDEATASDLLNSAINLLAQCGYTVKEPKGIRLLPLDSQKQTKNISVKRCAVIGRFSIGNAIYDDYSIMAKYSLTTPNINLLLKGKNCKEKRQNNVPTVFAINNLDYDQNAVIKKAATTSNVVIYGPPGTGKSQTITNIIGDAIHKGKKVLVVSQKQAALEVVFSRLGELNKQAMFLPDPNNDKNLFFERMKKAHIRFSSPTENHNYETQLKYCISNLDKETALLNQIRKALYSDTDFGINLQQMYQNSYNVGKNTIDYELYVKLQKNAIIKAEYSALHSAIDEIKTKNLLEIFIEYKKMLADNPLVKNIKNGADIHTLKECRSILTKLLSTDIKPAFELNQKYLRYALTFYFENGCYFNSTKIAADIMRIEQNELYTAKNLCYLPIFLPILPFVVKKYFKEKNEITAQIAVIDNLLQKINTMFYPFNNLLDEKGYSYLLESFVYGNNNALRLVEHAITEYQKIKDLCNSIAELPPLVKSVLDFCYTNSTQSVQTASTILSKIMPLRIYHEIIIHNSANENALKNIVCFYNTRQRISELKKQICELNKAISTNKFSADYNSLMNYSHTAKDYLYQLNKTKNLWNIKNFIDKFYDYVMTLFPCWILTPQDVSELFPLKKELFDIVIFDEASQILIENAIPTIYRGEKIVVAGDNKQLRPSTGFLKRKLSDATSYLEEADMPTQAALESVSLLDLAESKFNPAYLNYHYRSDYSELIDFSNALFYENRLEIAPNNSINIKNPPIRRILVNGTWQGQKNIVEAKAVLELIKKIFAERNDETIGIVTFNSNQKDCITELFENEAQKSPTFGKMYYKETHRFTDGKNYSLFIKNLENVQGDERDIIIFSVGYAKNSAGRLCCQFGALSMEGGENRLNVAITRAKKQIYVVTSIEPEQLTKADCAKNNGPKLLKKYLTYVRAVDENNTCELIGLLSDTSTKSSNMHSEAGLVEEIAEKLTGLGYDVVRDLGNAGYKLPIAVLDKNLGKYLLGITFDYGEFEHDDDAIAEKYLSKLDFLENKGWKIVTVWSRDWWLSPEKTINTLVQTIEIERGRVTIDAS